MKENHQQLIREISKINEEIAAQEVEKARLEAELKLNTDLIKTASCELTEIKRQWDIDQINIQNKTLLIAETQQTLTAKEIELSEINSAVSKIQGEIEDKKSQHNGLGVINLDGEGEQASPIPSSAGACGKDSPRIINSAQTSPGTTLSSSPALRTLFTQSSEADLIRTELFNEDTDLSRIIEKYEFFTALSILIKYSGQHQQCMMINAIDLLELFSRCNIQDKEQMIKLILREISSDSSNRTTKIDSFCNGLFQDISHNGYISLSIDQNTFLSKLKSSVDNSITSQGAVNTDTFFTTIKNQ